MKDDIPRTDRPRQLGTPLPWVLRAAETLLCEGPEAIALRQRDWDEQLAILGAVVALVRDRGRHRPRPRRRAA
jgi:hypothetical protein